MRFVSQIVRQEQAAQRHGLIATVVHLEPITAVGGIGHPLVDFERAKAAETGRVVGCAGRRHRQGPVARSIRHASDGEVGRLQPKPNAVQQSAAGQRTMEQKDGISFLAQPETGVRARDRRSGVAIDKQITGRRDGGVCREHPFAGRVGVVTQTQVRKVQGVG